MAELTYGYLYYQITKTFFTMRINKLKIGGSNCFSVASSFIKGLKPKSKRIGTSVSIVKQSFDDVMHHEEAMFI